MSLISKFLGGGKSFTSSDDIIRSKADMRRFLAEDMKVNLIDRHTWRGRIDYYFNPRIRFIVVLRHYEYCANTGKLMALWWYWRFKRLSYKLGYTIYKNNFGPGLYLAHYGTIVVNYKARIGSHCTIHACTNIGGGGGGGRGGAPTLGNNVFIGPGAKIFSSITIGDNVSIGANAVVNKSFPSNVVIAGVPAKIVKYKETTND